MPSRVSPLIFHTQAESGRTFNMPTYFIPILGVGKRGAYSLVHGDISAKAALVRNYLEVYWPCANGLSSVNAVGTHLRDPINSGLARWRMAILNKKWTPLRNSGGIPQLSTIFSLSMEMSRLKRDRTAEPVSRDQILRRERGQGNIYFPCSADHVKDWQPYPIDPCSCYIYVTIHT